MEVKDMKIKQVIATVLFSTLMVSLVPTAESFAYSGDRCTVYEALRHRAKPSLQATVLGIIYPGEIVYDQGLDELCMSMDSEFNRVYRPKTSQTGYCDHHYLKYDV